MSTHLWELHLWIRCLFLQNSFAIAFAGLLGLSLPMKPTACLFFYLGLPRSLGDVISTPRPCESYPDAWDSQGTSQPKEEGTDSFLAISLHGKIHPLLRLHLFSRSGSMLGSWFQLLTLSYTKSPFLFVDVGSPWLLSWAVQTYLRRLASFSLIGFRQWGISPPSLTSSATLKCVFFNIFQNCIGTFRFF